MFNSLKLLVQNKFNALQSKSKLFYCNIDRDLIWSLYLDGFVDPVERQGHDCNCCKSFLRQYAGIVSIEDNKVQSIWDIEVEELYAPSIKNIRNYIHSLKVTDIYLNSFAKCGTDKNTDLKNGHLWEHFFIVLSKEFVHKVSTSIETVQGTYRDNKSVLKRSLDELTADSVDTVLELIAQNSLYRGKESEGILTEFKKIQKEYNTVPIQLKDNYCWATSLKVSAALTRIRNSAIGTLLTNLSENMDLDTAVSKFEAVVAPTNYKRPASLVTAKMIEQAKAKLEELGMRESLERRFAIATDLDIKDILFIDKSSSLTDVFEDMKKDAQINPKSFSKIEEVNIEDFIQNILPKSKGISVLLENSHLNNMVTLLTSVNKDSPLLFKWDNPFSWAYSGGITDSIKEKVKAAGGRVDGELRVSLSWFNYDDLDLHVHEPKGNEIYYSKKSNPNTTGTLDVDMNAGSAKTRSAVENIVWTNKKSMEEGTYKVVVHNFSRRETIDKGFIVQIECQNEVFDFEFDNSPKGNEHQKIITFSYSKTKGIIIDGEAKSTLVNKDKWELKTNRFHKVKNILLSPNFWNNKIGNKHYMFLLENCISNEPTRPFFNEFLKGELDTHRKFFEILGTKLNVSPTNTQLSGLGFSETQRNHLIVKVEGSFKRTIKINF